MERLEIKMSKFTKIEQTNIVKQAMELETAIQNGQRELLRLKREKFEDAPDEPVRKVINQNVQTVAPDYSALPQVNYTFVTFLEDDIKTKPTILNKLFSAHPFRRCLIIFGICSVLSSILIPIGTSTVMSFLTSIIGAIAFFAIPVTVIYWFVKKSAYTNKKKELDAALTQEPDYIQAKAEADRIAEQKQMEIAEDLRNQQADLDCQYAKAKEQYDTVVMPKYKAELAAWTTEHDKKVQEVTDKLEADRRAQAELYETSKIIPMQYRDVEALTYIYQLMSTSEYDLKEAVDMYDKELKRQQEEARIKEMQRANNLADEQNYRLMQQNELLNDQNELQYQQNAIAEKQRKDDRRREIETEYHRHQIRKNLKNNK